jgi:2-iminobutanoate/2-iminopropanoate deaminase
MRGKVEANMKNTKMIAKVMAVAAGMLAPLALLAADAAPNYIVTDHSAARAQLPFSDGVVAGNTLYVAGTIGVDPKTVDDPKGPRVPDDTSAEAKLVMEGVKHTVEAAGFKMDDLVSIQVYCTDLGLYGAFNDIYRSYFHAHFPARAFIGVDKLVRGAHFEVMGTAVKGSH